MTGYASASAQPDTRQLDNDGSSLVGVEIRSVNSRFLDLVFRLPDELRALEPALRELCQKELRRGKVEVRITLTRQEQQAWPQPRPEQLNQLARLQEQVRGWLSDAPVLSVNEVLHWCRGGASAAAPDDAAVISTVKQCLSALNEARAREGTQLTQMLLQRLSTLRDLALQAEPLIPAAVQRHRERFTERWRDALQSAGSHDISESALQDRALNEAAAYALRIDVAEELSRLRSHLGEIERLLSKGGELGKRLDFLIQELHREANTLGSKSVALELTSISVDMKVAIEQMREQVQNLE
ncbi:YicC/YloC family endoribonuclease [Roseateles sp. BYS180W]